MWGGSPMGTQPVETPDRPILERPLVWLSQATSRRSFLSRIFKLSLVAAGIGVGYQWLFGGLVREAEASHCGSSCIWCGLCGKRCDLCGTSGSTTCPSGTFRSANAWGACCGRCCGYRLYYDCCTSSGAVCSASFCYNNCPQPAWCSYYYYCTISVFQSLCGGC